MLKLTLAAGLAIAALSTTANAADIVQPPAATTPSSATDWSGFYAGINGGYGPGTALSTDDNFWSDVNDGEIDFSGWLYGGQIGYDFSLGNGLVVGLQGDLEKTSETGSQPGYDSGYTVSDTLNWTGAVTGRIGYVWDGYMPYVLGGIAFANNTITNADDGGGGSATNTQTGFTIGAGIEAMFAEHISGFLEARYSDYGTMEYGAEDSDNTPEVGPVTLTDATVRGGINYHF